MRKSNEPKGQSTISTTSRVLLMEFPQPERAIRKKGTLWSPSYYVGSAGNVSATTIQKYIEETQHI